MSISTARTLDEVGRHQLAKIIAVFNIYYMIVKMLLKNKYHLCYLTINSKGPAFFKEMVIVFICKLFRRNMVYHYHNKGISKVHRNFIYHQLYRYQFKNSQMLMLSPLLYLDVKKYLPQSRISYCANGVSAIESIDVQSLCMQRSQNPEVELLFLSNLMKLKGVYTLLDVCKILKDKNLNFNLTFIGAPIKIDKINSMTMRFQTIW